MKNINEKAGDAQFKASIIKDHSIFLNINIIKYNKPVDNHYMLGSGKIYLNLAYGEFQKLDADNKKIVPKKIGLRPIEKFYRFSTLNKTKEIRIGLKPQRWFHLTRVKAKDWGKEDFDLIKIVGYAQADLVYKRLEAIEEPEDVLEILDDELRPYFKTWSQTTPVEEIMDYIHEKGGRVGISDILMKFHISRSSLHNYFDTYIGFSPKFYIRLIRFNQIIVKYFNNNTTIAEIIRDEDYYDYSHFKKDFEQFTGYIPAQFGGVNDSIFRKFIHDSHIWIPTS